MFLSSYRNTSGSLGKREILWEHEHSHLVKSCSVILLLANQKGCKSKKISVTSDYLKHANVTLELNRVPYVYWYSNMKVPKDSQSFGIPSRTKDKADKNQFIEGRTIVYHTIATANNNYQLLRRRSRYVFTLFIEPELNRQRWRLKVQEYFAFCWKQHLQMTAKMSPWKLRTGIYYNWAIKKY